MFTQKKILVALISLILTSCCFFNGESNFFYNRDRDYLSGYSIAPICIPPCLSSSKIEARYPVADRVYPNRFQPIDLTPPELYAPCVAQSVRPMIVPVSPRPCVTPQRPLYSHNQYIDQHTRSTTGSGMYVPDLLPKKVAQQSPNSATMEPAQPQQQLAQNKEANNKTPNIYTDRFARR